jgi:predicted Fe-Mo cluster-binding NifX family protein
LKVAVSATGGSLDAAVDPRFGRCPYFVIVDTETMRSEAVQNTSMYAPSGAGIQAAQTVASKGVRAVLTGSVGPNAYQALSAAGVKIMTGVAGTVREAVESYKKGELAGVSGPTADMGYGMGGGFAMGMGRGGGRGRGMGRGMGMRGFVPPAYPGVPSVPTTPQVTKEQEVQMLKSQMELLQAQLDQIKKRLEELGRKK